jgi:hypothetical protein
MNMGLSSRKKIAESEHFEAFLYTSLGMSGWNLEMQRKGDKEHDFYFYKHDKNEVVELLKSISKMMEKEINEHEDHLEKPGSKTSGCITSR